MKNKRTTKEVCSNILMERQEEMFLHIKFCCFVVCIKKSIKLGLKNVLYSCTNMLIFFIKSASTVKGLSDHILFFGGCKIS